MCVFTKNYHNDFSYPHSKRSTLLQKTLLCFRLPEVILVGNRCIGLILVYLERTKWARKVPDVY